MKTESKFLLWVFLGFGILAWLGYLSTPSELSQRVSKGLESLMEKYK